MKMETYQHGI